MGTMCPLILDKIQADECNCWDKLESLGLTWNCMTNLKQLDLNKTVGLTLNHGINLKLCD